MQVTSYTDRGPTGAVLFDGDAQGLCMVCHWKQNSGGVGKGYREAEGGDGRRGLTWQTSLVV